ncbi:MAG: hypothetical protein K6D94_08910 [Clostridiales bacterium]|nr:hypothetical protein [Clostridiales bacterium]
MFDYEYRDSADAGRVCLEISLKPFGRDMSDEGVRAAAVKLFTQWMPLLRRAKGCSVLFWTSDGSEILEYTGDLDREFEWCRYIGIGNWDRSADPKDDKDAGSLHHFPINYIEDPPKMTYRNLKRIISVVKEVGREITGFEIEAGETFDPGPEFAWSDFKYVRHPEIAQGSIMGQRKWVHCAALLHADERSYAGFPDGIEEGTTLGRFLGRQFKALAADVGFDYIWLSNGFGFSLQSWNWTGEMFDGHGFDTEGMTGIHDKILRFWEDFTAETGDIRIETRGSNLFACCDIASHGSPLGEICKCKTLVAPPNSPWAPLNYRFGLELAGYMSHIADLPPLGFNFRYYIHDPWWLNSPWFDRYDRSPHDIYLPLSIARLDDKLSVTKPYGISFLSADDSFGRLPDRCPNEVIPHILAAYNDYPDEPGIVTWVYPIGSYCDTVFRNGHPENIFMDDWLVESGIDNGFPVNTVISDSDFIKTDKSKLRDTVLLIPVPAAGSVLERAVFDALNTGVKVILFGSAARMSPAMLKRAGLKLSEESAEGEMTVSLSPALLADTAENGGYSRILRHTALVSGGPVIEEASDSIALAEAAAESGRRYAYMTEKNGLIWIRGSFPHDERSGGSLPPVLPRDKYFSSASLLRCALARFGTSIRFECFDSGDSLPIIHLSRCRGALYLNEFAKDASIRMRMSLPDGAPAFDNSEFIVSGSEGRYPLSRWIHTDCRIFVRQKERSKITVKKDHPVTHIDVDERTVVTGLKDAVLTVYPPKGGTVFIRFGDDLWNGGNVPLEYDGERDCWISEPVSGRVNVCVQEAENIGDYRKLEFIRKG